MPKHETRNDVMWMSWESMAYSIYRSGKKNNACTVKPRYNDMGYNKLMNIMKQS